MPKISHSMGLRQCLATKYPNARMNALVWTNKEPPWQNLLGSPSSSPVALGGPLGSMGKPTEMVVAGRLCCAGCEPNVIADPVKYLAAINQTWQAKKGKFKPAPDSANHSGHHHGGE
jgi:hypothetical protein